MAATTEIVKDVRILVDHGNYKCNEIVQVSEEIAASLINAGIADGSSGAIGSVQDTNELTDVM